MKDEEDQTPNIIYIIKLDTGSFFLASFVDYADGGYILEVDKELVKNGIFPDTFVDSRFLHLYQAKLFVFTENQRNETMH